MILHGAPPAFRANLHDERPEASRYRFSRPPPQKFRWGVGRIILPPSLPSTQSRQRALPPSRQLERCTVTIRGVLVSLSLPRPGRSAETKPDRQTARAARAAGTTPMPARQRPWRCEEAARAFNHGSWSASRRALCHAEGRSPGRAGSRCCRGSLRHWTGQLRRHRHPRHRAGRASRPRGGPRHRPAARYWPGAPRCRG